MIYFDNAASTKPRPEAVAAMNAVLESSYANPNALHKGGIEAEKVIAAARETILSRLFGNRTPQAGRLIFTSGATESNNLAIMGAVKPRGKSGVTTTLFEHPSVSQVISRLEPQYKITLIPPKDNIVDFLDFIDENTALVSINAVCSETGFMSNVVSVYREVKRRFPDCIVHADGAQAFAKTPLDGDLISLSSHKFGGVCGAVCRQKHCRSRSCRALRNSTGVRVWGAVSGFGNGANVWHGRGGRHAYRRSR
jgi:cysteine desulfurase